MKKIFFSLLAIAAIASCAKTEPVYTDVDSEIQLAPVTALQTKANTFQSIDGTTYPANEHFTVKAYWNEAGAGSNFTENTTVYLNSVDFKKQTTSNYWAGANESYYWPKNGSLRFATYSPTEFVAGTMNHVLATDTWTATGYEQANDTDVTIDFMVAQTPPSYTAATAAEKVSVVFEHALSWLSFRVQAKDEAAMNAFDVKSITVNNVFTKGDMVAKYPAKDWTVTAGSEKPYVVVSDAPGLDLTPVDIENNGVLVIPQATTTVTVTFVQNTLGEVTQSLEIPLILDGENTPWVAGKHYIYTLIFGLDEILINPSVADWEDVVVPSVEATAVEVGTPAELISAVASGRSVRLVNDIVVDAPVKVNGGDVLVELNGYSVKSEGDVFEVAAGTLAINGPGLVEAATDNGTPYCAVWAYGDAVVNIYGGEYKAGYPAGDYNDLIYAKDNAQINVYGGKFYNSGKENSFVLNLKDNTNAQMVVYGGSFEKFNPANNASEGANTNFVAKGYNVVAEGNWYNVFAPESVELTANADAAETVYVAGNFDGAGFTLAPVEGVDYVISNTARLIEATAPSTISNVVIDGKNHYSGDYGIRGIYTIGTGDVTIKDVKILNCTYAINANNAGKLTVINATLQGWNSYGSTTQNLFENVKFIDGKFHNFRPYNTTECVNCDFGTGVVIDLSCMVEGATINFVNCTYNGAPLTEANLTDATGKAYTIK